MSNLEAHSLIIKSMSMLEEVCAEYEEKLAPAIFDEIDSIVKKFASEQCWNGLFEQWKSDSTWFAPSDWKIDDSEESEDIAWYHLILSKYNNETACDDYHFYLSPLLGIGATQAGFSFKVERKFIGNPKAGEWKKFCQNHPHYTEIGTKGFIYLNSGTWFIPFKIDTDVLADAYCAGNTVDALQPVSEALDKIKDAHHLFDQVLTDAKAKKWGQ